MLVVHRIIIHYLNKISMKKQSAAVLLITGMVAVSCSKDPLKNMTEEESRIYITNYDTTAQFGSYNTFYIADSMAIVSNDQYRGKELNATASALINAVSNALQARGYTKVTRNDAPDLAVALSAVTNTSTGVVAYQNYGGYYGSYWDPYYWGYPGSSYYFPTYYGTYQISETALAVDVFDLKNRQQNNGLKALWNGLIRGSGIFRNENATKQVDMLFAQSPYLKTN